LINGSDVVQEFDRASYSVDPFRDPKWITFNDSNGKIWKGIYAFENGKLRMMQSSPGLQRPTFFDPSTFPPAEPGAPQGYYSLSPLLLERVPIP
ncbi:MAG: hypothetical protein N2B03_02660, partial [Boseongicola sp.]